MAAVGRVLLMPRGNYVNTDVYNRLDWVRYNGVSWVCKVDNTTGVAPSISATEWQVLAQDGTVGGWTSISGKPFSTIGNGLLVNSGDELMVAKNMITDKVTIQAVNELLTGTGTAGYDAGAGASPRYFPAKWIFNTTLTSISDGDMITIKLPVAGSDYGIYLSVDGGINFYPTALYDAIKLNTEYGVGSYVTFIFNSNGYVENIYPIEGGDTPGTVTGGAFRVLNYTQAALQNYYTKAEIDSQEQPLAKNGGSKTWNELITNSATYLVEANANKFYRLTTAGTVDTSNENLFVAGIIDGEHFSADSHIAVVEESAGVYKYDYFGGGIEPEVYFDSTATALTYTFTHDAITTDSAIFPCSSIVGDKYTNITVNNHTCTVTMATSASRTVRIYVK